MEAEQVAEWLYHLNVRLLRIAIRTGDLETKRQLSAAVEHVEAFLTEVRTNRSNIKEK